MFYRQAKINNHYGNAQSYRSQNLEPVDSNMLSTEVVLKVAHAVVYLILLGVGIYFIEQGDIVEKFSERKTNFAETLGGQITELPTIVTFIEPLHGDLKLGVDFNISYAIAVRFNPNPNLAEDDILVNLVEGTNILDAERQIAIYRTKSVPLTDLNYLN